MLILQRKPGEALRIGDNIMVSIVSIDSGRVRIAIDAPTEIPILRSELIENIAVNQESVLSNASVDELIALWDTVAEPPEAGEKKN